MLTERLNDEFLGNHGLDTTPLGEGVEDYDNANRGKVEDFTSKEKTVYRLNEDWVEDTEVTVWNLLPYDELIANNNGGAITPSTVNPSLWRNFRLNMEYGLYEVIPGHIYQVRGLDLSNITFVRTPGNDTNDLDVVNDDGWLVLDPLMSKETAKAALEFINNYMTAKVKLSGTLPVKGVLYSHSHIDHFGGVRGLFGSTDNKEGDAPGDMVIFAPKDFTDEAVSENVIAGNAMGRRAIYMYGALTGVDNTGKKGVGSGLGLTNSLGESTLIVPTHSITETTEGEESLLIGLNGIEYQEDGTWEGLRMQFQMTPGTEAPAEMNTYFMDWNALWMAENSTNTMHNVLTLRGAKVRDPLIWSKFLTETIERWGNSAVVKFQAHHWPVWEYEEGDDASSDSLDKIVPYLEKQRDIYKYIHDQTVRMMNQGFIGEEISERITLPEGLDSNWATRGYYGTLRHNSRAVYQRYMGWYSGNPSDLNNLPPEKVANKYVEYMGGPGAILDSVVAEINDVNSTTGLNAAENEEVYRWAAEVLKHIVFAEDDGNGGWGGYNMEQAQQLLADVYEQLGYMAESGPWRGVFLQGALELRDPNYTEQTALTTASADIITNMSLDMAFDFWAVQLDPDNFDYDFTININVQPLGDDGAYTLTVKNAVLNYTENQIDSLPDGGQGIATVTLSKDTLNAILMTGNFDQDDILVTDQDDQTIEGDSNPWTEFGRLFVIPEFWFPIVTPRSGSPYYNTPP